MKPSLSFCSLVLAVLLPLANGCTRSGAPGAARPGPAPTTTVTTSPARPGRPGAAAPVPSTPGAVLTIGENERNKTVRIGRGETLAIRLAVDESTGNRWFLSNRLEGGILYKKGNTTYAPTPAGNVATVLYTGLKAGTQELHFYYAPPEARQNVTQSADFRVIVR